MPIERFEREQFAGFGECIYCGASGNDTELTDEHVVALSLGGNVEILDASCKQCAKETSKCEQEISRNALYDFRTHTNIQTRRPKKRPRELPFSVEVEGDELKILTVPIQDHPFFTPMPVWGMPGLLRGTQPDAPWAIKDKAHLFYSIPDNISQTLGLEHGQKAEIRIPEFNINHERYARAIAKIAYCQAVIRYGLHGFRRLVLPQLILGQYPFVSYFVGSDPDGYPPPPLDRNVIHSIELEPVSIGNLRLIEAAVRLFANSGTADHGPPIYRVVVGAPLLSRRGRP